MIKLSESEKDLLNKLSVRTAKLNSEYQQYDQGSGTLFASGDNCYVLTAGHCVNGVDEHHIVVEYYNGSIYRHTRVRSIVVCKYNEETEEDYAVLLVDKPDNEVDYISVIKRFDLSIPEDNYIMFSYPPNAREGRIFEMKKNVKDYWEVSVPVNYAIDDFKSAIEGSSGSGIVVYRHNRFYYVGLVTRTRNSAGVYNDIKTLSPSIFDGFIPSDTKDNDYFDTIKSWDDWHDNKNQQERREIIRDLNIHWLDYLSRKMQILYPNSSEKKVDTYIMYYLKGLDIINKMLLSNASFVQELNKHNDKFFDRLLETHKEDFESSEGAYLDLEGIVERVEQSVALKFPEDKDGIITHDYAYYRIAERLLNCTLDYYYCHDRA